MNYDRFITVMIAEDEPIILNNIAKKVQNSANYIKVIGKAQNGLKIMELMKNQIPDILITDIEMPGMNGLELIKEIYTQYPSVHIVILSGYDNFEYARAAIRYEVKEYILKPVSQKDLTSVLLKLSENILKEKQNKERNILSMTLSGFTNDVIPSQYFKEKTFILSLVTLGNLPSKHTQVHYLDHDLNCWNNIQFQECFSNNTSIFHFWVIDEMYRLQKFIIFHVDAEKTSADYINMALYNYLSTILKDMPFHIVTNKEAIPYTNIWTAAKQLRQFTKQVTTMCSKSYHLFPSDVDCSLSSTEQKAKIDFLYQITTLNQLTKYVEETIQYYVDNKISQQYIDNFICECYQLLPLLFSLENHACQLAMNSILSLLQSYQKPEQLCSEITASLRELYRNFSPETTTDFLYEKIRQYIKNNYCQKITAESLSKRYGYTPSYINRIFKKEGQTSPLQYMTTLRIEHAKELLKQNMDIKSIAATVGYDDARYFSRVFKNETGLTPSAWAQQETGGTEV